MTPYELTGLGVIISYYIVKWWRDREKEEIDDDYYNLDLCSRKKRGIVRGNFNTLLHPGLRKSFTQPGTTDNNINKGFLPGFTEEYWEERTGIHDVYPGKMWHIDRDMRMVTLEEGVELPLEELQKYDDEYWRIMKEKIRREREEG